MFGEDEDEPKVVAKSSSIGSSGKSKGRSKKQKSSDSVDDDEDDAPEEVSMATQRAAAEAQLAKERAARDRVMQEKQAKNDVEAVRQAKREAQKAAKLARQEQQQASQQQDEEQIVSSQSQADFLPADLLNALGQNVTSPRAPQRVQSAEAVKKDAVDRRLSQIWQETGIQVAVVKKPVEVTLPKAMLDFMEECKAAIPRTAVAEKKKRVKRTMKTVI